MNNEPIPQSTLVMVNNAIDKALKEYPLSINQANYPLESKEEFDERLYKMAMVWWYQKQWMKKDKK